MIKSLLWAGMLGVGYLKERALIKDVILKHNPTIGILPETKCSSLDRTFIKSIWSAKTWCLLVETFDLQWCCLKVIQEALKHK